MAKYWPLPNSKMNKNFPNWFISFLHFCENIMKILIKMANLQMHENLHKNVNE